MASILRISRSAACRFGTTIGLVLVAVLVCGRAWAEGDELGYDAYDELNHPHAAELWEGYRDPGIRFWSEPPGPVALTVDWRVRTMFNSHTSYQFGTAPQLDGPQYAPVSKLDWSLDSTWTGFRFGLEEANSAAHFEWLTPMGQSISGGMYDYDWNINDPRDDPTRLDSLSRSSERWHEGQMLDMGYEFRLLERPLGLPVDLWPLIGFRWQRFGITAYAGDQMIPPDGPFPPPFDSDIITFKQEYSIGYLGTQLRGKLESGLLPPIAWTLQGDWGYTQANNVDHHLYYEYFDSHRYTMEDTHGDCLHVGLTAETLFCHDRFSIGLQADYMEIRTTGSHHWVQYGGTSYAPVDKTWTNGVSVQSHQTAITAFLRLRV